MKVICQKSGLIFTCEHFKYYSDTATISHPCFSIPQKKLLALTPKWATGDFSEIDSYLLFLSLLDSTGQVEFRAPVQYTAATPSIVLNNMETLIRLVGVINCITNPHLVLSRVAISKENHTLESVTTWIENWHEAIEEYKDGYISIAEQQDLVRREAALEKLIKSSYNEVQLATQIANWAELAGSFPDFSVRSPFGEHTCSEYWKLIIRKCVNAESIFSIPSSDIQELIEHCEEHIPHGSIYAHTLMGILRNGLNKQHNFLGLGETTGFVLLESDDEVQQANIQLIVQTAPTEEPRVTDYSSRFEWLRAHTKWKIAQQIASKQRTQESNQNPALTSQSL